MGFFFSTDLQKKKEQLAMAIADLHFLTGDVRHESLHQTVGDLKERILEPFLFVIVGEVKAGKSSFINALLSTDRQICKVAPNPCTDVIQQLLYGEQESEEVVNPHLRKRYVNFDILKEIAIVDTPGTNTIVAHHQEITERFVPGSDLIVFVFEAKNPYRQSAWEFFDYIHKDWHKKIVFVLQQKDLMEPDDLKINIQGVKDYAAQKGIQQPLVFAVSAKLELEGDKQSGYGELRSYIADNITGGKAPQLKVENIQDTALQICHKISDSLKIRRTQYDSDMKFIDEVRKSLADQAKSSENHADMLVENLLAGYQAETDITIDKINSGFGILSIASRALQSIFSKSKSTEAWLQEEAQDLEQRLNHTMEQKVQRGVVDLAESIQQMGKVLDLKIRHNNSINLLNKDAIFGDIADKRAGVMRELHETFSDFINRPETYMDKRMETNAPDITPAMLKGGGLAVIGIVLTSLTQLTAVDITGGVLTGIGIIFAGGSMYLSKGKVINSLKEEVGKGKARFKGEVEVKLKDYIQQLRLRFAQNFSPFEEMLGKEGKELGAFEQRLQSIVKNLNA